MFVDNRVKRAAAESYLICPKCFISEASDLVLTAMARMKSALPAGFN